MKKYQIRLYELRTDRDLRQIDLANVLKCSKHSYGHYENGKRSLPIDHLETLCEFYKVSADYILGLPKGLEYPER